MLILGSSHQVTSLKPFFNKIQDRVEEMEKEAIDKRKKLECLSEQTTQILVEFDEETGVLVNGLQATRDEQVTV